MQSRISAFRELVSIGALSLRPSAAWEERKRRPLAANCRTPERGNSCRSPTILCGSGSRLIGVTKVHPGMRRLAWAIALLGLYVSSSAHADIYTWVDSSGNMNLSNRPPPEGARVTNVFREDPAVRASAEAARAAAQRDELQALTERVTQLERDLDTATTATRPAPAPIVYMPPAPVPYPSVMVEPIVVPAAPNYGDCSNPWASCFSPGYFGFYPGGIIVLDTSGSHRPHRAHPMHRVATPVGHTHFPKPVGALPDPPNLFPGVHRR